MKLTIGFSPCPNDTFIFDALVNGKIDTGGIIFEPVLEDVETLNRWAKEEKLDISKLSFPALFQMADRYAVLSSGSALGNGVGPLLIAKEAIALEHVAAKTIAIPGLNTTANFLLSFAFPEADKRTPVLFSDIESNVLQHKFDVGLIIHENRFTYAQKGLHKLMDLGQHWEEKTGLPIPLGCIAVKRAFAKDVQQKINALIYRSLQYAFKNYPQLPPYVEAHAQEMDRAVMRQHIDLYVNDFSLNLGIDGEKAIEALYAVYCNQQNIPPLTDNLFAS